MTEKFSTIQLEGASLMTINGLIYVPQELQHKIVAWYHQYLAHPGQSRMEATIRQNFTWPNIRDHVKTFCATCPQCQINKRQRKKYGHLPAKEAEYLPWERVNVDLIGPYSYSSNDRRFYTRIEGFNNDRPRYQMVRNIPYIRQKCSNSNDCL